MACSAEPAFGEAGRQVVIEEFLRGEEASIFAVTDGKEYRLLAPAQDHKRALDGDGGKNTGGMGAYAPAPVVTPEILRRVEAEVLRPTLAGMASEGHPYQGCLYIGLMLTSLGPRVIEYNCRFGDPETQVVLPLFRGDLARTLLGAATGRFSELASSGWNPEDTATAACVVLAAGGYPGRYETGNPIEGLHTLDHRGDVVAFHAGTRIAGSDIVTSGGRVLGISAMSESGGLAQTLRLCYEAIAGIHFKDMHYRRDIGHRALSVLITITATDIMNILVTGGAGFIASHIAEAYIKAGHQVTVIDNLSTGRRKNIPDGATFVEADIRDPEAVKSLFRVVPLRPYESPRGANGYTPVGCRSCL